MKTKFFLVALAAAAGAGCLALEAPGGESLHGRVFPMARITAENARGDESQKTWRGRAWRNERVHAAFALWGSDRGDLRATAEPLVGPGGATIPLKVRWVREVIADDRPHMAKVDPAKHPPYKVGDVLDEEQPFRLAEGGHRGVWASAKTPADAPVGVYRGRLVVAGGGTRLVFPLELEIVADALPAEKKFHLDIWQTPWTIARYYGLTPFSEAHYAKMEPFFRELADAGQKTITTTITDYPWNERENIDSARSMVKYVKRRDGAFVADFSVMDGFVAFAEKCGIGPQIHCYAPVKFEQTHTYQYFDEAKGEDVSVKLLPATPEYEAYWGPLLAQLETHAKEKGWTGRLYVALDELPGKDAAATAALIARHAPSAKFQMAGNRVPSEFKGVEIDSYSQQLRNSRYVPASFLDEVAKRRAEGRITTVYTCCNPFRPNCLPMNPLHEQRWMGLFIAAKGFDGYLKSTFFRWVKSTDPLVDTHCYPFFPCGDSYLVYPGPRLSLRWESMVDGFEDWEKIRILKESGRFTPALAAALGRIDFVRYEKSDEATVRADVEACLREIDAASAVRAVAAPRDVELPPCGMLVGHAVYNYHGLYPGGYGTWQAQRGSPFDLVERTVKEEQGNLIQFWFFNGWRPLTKAAWLDMEELGFKCPQPDWKNLKNLSCDEFPEFAKHEKDRAGAGVLRAIRMCETNGIYSQLMYVSGVNEKYTREFTDNKRYVGYDFGERFTFRSENGGNENQDAPRLDKLADNLVASVRKHCDEHRAKGYGNVWCTSSNFFMDYEVYGGVDYTLFEDFTCDLNLPSALSRGLARQYGRNVWGGHVANEYYAWLASANPHFYRMLYSAFACKYVAGAKVLVSESGGWHAQTPGSGSPLGKLPKSRASYTAKTPSDAELAPLALEAEKLRDLASEEGHWSRSFRQALGDFYRYVKEHGTPAGQPESTFAIAKGNYDLLGGMLDGRPKPNSVVAGLHPYAEKHMEWMAGAPEFGWGIAGEVFWPRGQGIYGTKDLNRIFSGTPWGQVDIVSFAYDNVTAEHLLKNYRTLAFVGWNTCSDKQYKILCDYVKGGGRLFIAIPQLSKDLTRNYQAYAKEDLVNGGDFTELCGLKVTGRGPYFYWTGAVKGSSAGKWSSAESHGAYRGILGKVEISNPKAEPLLYNWENDMDVLYRLPSGKGEVWFLNSWYYPGAYNHSYGPGVGPGSLGFVEDVLKELARRSRGTAWISEKGADDPGAECAFVNWSYFPSTREVILFNVDFEKTHAVDLHAGGKTIPLDLAPQTLVRVPVK